MVRIRGNLYLLLKAALVRSVVPRMWLVEAIDAFKIHDSLLKECGRKPVVQTEHLRSCNETILTHSECQVNINQFARPVHETLPKFRVIEIRTLLWVPLDEASQNSICHRLWDRRVADRQSQHVPNPS